MTPDELDAIAEGYLTALRNYPPAEAMLILATLCSKAILSTTPTHIGALDKSVQLFFTQIVAGIEGAVKQAPEGFIQ